MEKNQPSSLLTQPIKWHGGKHYLAKRIIALMPPHVHYVEPYFGGGSVLLEKNPDGVSEVVNDINLGLTQFWMVLKDDAYFGRLKRLVEATPFSSFQFEKSVRELQSGDWTHDPALLAYHFFIVARQSRQGLMKDFATLSRNRTRRGMNEQASSWLTAIEGLPDVHARLKRVVILNDDAIKVIKQQDGDKTLFYLDPPYLHEMRETTSDFAHEMTPEQHGELLAVLATIKGKFILSGYPSKMYDAAARKNRWRRTDILIDNKASSKAVKEIKTECLWKNFSMSKQ